MPRLAPIAVALALALAALAAGPVAAKAPTVVGATAHDDDDSVPGMTLTLTRTKVDPAKATIDFFNAGADDHDLWVKRKGEAEPNDHTGLLGEHQGEELKLRLRKSSKYVLWCSIADHRDLGMEAALKVRKG